MGPGLSRLMLEGRGGRGSLWKREEGGGRESDCFMGSSPASGTNNSCSPVHGVLRDKRWRFCWRRHMYGGHVAGH